MLPSLSIFSSRASQEGELLSFKIRLLNSLCETNSDLKDTMLAPYGECDDPMSECAQANDAETLLYQLLNNASVAMNGKNTRIESTVIGILEQLDSNMDTLVKDGLQPVTTIKLLAHAAMTMVMRKRIPRKTLIMMFGRVENIISPGLWQHLDEAEQNQCLTSIEHMKISKTAAKMDAKRTEEVARIMQTLKTVYEASSTDQEKKHNEMILKMSELGDGLTGLQTTVLELKKGLDQRDQKQLGDVEKRLSVAQDKNEELRQLVLNLTADTSGLQAQLDAKDTAIADKDAIIADKDATITDKNTAIATKDAAIATKDAAITALKKQIIDEQKQIGALKDQIIEEQKKFGDAFTRQVVGGNGAQ